MDGTAVAYTGRCRQCNPRPHGRTSLRRNETHATLPIGPGIKCRVQSVRFLNLKAGSIIKPHRDHGLAFEKGEARLHFPVVTNPQVEFYVEETHVDMQPGTCWYINANLVHRVSNRGTTDRIHLVVDCLVNDWLRDLFDRADKQTKNKEIDAEKQKQVISALRLQNTPTSIQLADQMEKELWI